MYWTMYKTSICMQLKRTFMDPLGLTFYGLAFASHLMSGHNTKPIVYFSLVVVSQCVTQIYWSYKVGDSK